MNIKKLKLEKLEEISDSKLRTFRGGKNRAGLPPVTAPTLTVPDGKDDGDDGIKND